MDTEGHDVAASRAEPRQRERLKFEPTDWSAVEAARKKAETAKAAREAECNIRGQRCRDREDAEAKALAESEAASKNKTATEHARELDAQIEKLTAKIAEKPVLEANSQGSALARLFGLPDAKADRVFPRATRPIPLRHIRKRRDVVAHKEKSEKSGKNGRVKAVAYLRTSSAANVGADKDSEKRQRQAITAYAKAAKFEIATDDWFYDPAVSGADPIETRPGFNKLLDRIEGNGVRVVIIEDATRFARDLMTQELGILSLIKLGVRIITATGDDPSPTPRTQ